MQGKIIERRSNFHQTPHAVPWSNNNVLASRKNSNSATRTPVLHQKSLKHWPQNLNYNRVQVTQNTAPPATGNTNNNNDN